MDRQLGELADPAVDGDPAAVLLGVARRVVDGVQHLGQCRFPGQRLVALGTVFVEPLLQLRVGALQIGYRVVERLRSCTGAG